MPILRGTNSALLPCGCVIGRYETYRGESIAIVDLKGSRCTDRVHRVNARVPWNPDYGPAPGNPLTFSLPQDPLTGAQP